MKTELTIQIGFVYENEAGEPRLVVAIDSHRQSPVAIWRTSDPNLPKGTKAQGSATVANFRKWAVKMRSAGPEDWSAFQQVQQLRAWNKLDTKAIRQFKLSRDTFNI